MQLNKAVTYGIFLIWTLMERLLVKPFSAVTFWQLQGSICQARSVNVVCRSQPAADKKQKQKTHTIKNGNNIDYKTCQTFFIF